VKKMKSNLEKTTLGDISELASLKSEMEEEQRKEFEKKHSEAKDEEKGDDKAGE